MEIISKIIQQLPPIWPRLLILAVLIGLVALPHTRRILKRGAGGKQKLDRAKQLLELRKLEIQVEAMRAEHPNVPESALDEEIRLLLAKPPDPTVDDTPPLAWVERMKLAGYATLAFLVLSVLVMGFSGRREGSELATFAFREVLVLVPCALIASAIPTRNRWVKMSSPASA